MSLESKGSSALVVAMRTGKGLLTSVGLHVIFKNAGSIAGKVALVTMKRLLS